jgi:hypothetical protein
MKIALFDQGKRLVWKQNLQIASKELCWENEEEVLRQVYKRFL